MADKPLSGKIAFVTGAGSPIGFGRAMTFALVRAGARVAMFDIKEDWLNETARLVRNDYGEDTVLPLVGSVASPRDVEHAVEDFEHHVHACIAGPFRQSGRVIEQQLQRADLQQ